jgi:hypothetical protein
MGSPIFFDNQLNGEIGFYDEGDLASLAINAKRAPNWLIYVFGSNLKGIHGAGSAKFARENFGARIGQGVGFQGKSYAIPTKERPELKGRSLGHIANDVEEFCAFTKEHSEFNYIVTAIGTGFAGHRHIDIAPMFTNANNCWFPVYWSRYLYKN